MALPNRQDFLLPTLKIAGDGNEHSNQEFYEKLAQEFGLTKTDRAEMLPSDTEQKFNNRVRWACTDLRHALLLSSAGSSKFRITERGMNVLKENPSHIDHEYLKRFPEFVNYMS